MSNDDTQLARNEDHDHERKRLEATAIVASRVSREESHLVIRAEKLRTLVREAVIILLVIAVALLAYRNSTEGKRTKAAVIKAAQVNCKQYKDIAQIPLTEIPRSGVVTLSLVADFRNSYYGFDCQDATGQLRKPDPWLLPYLDANAKVGVGDPIPRQKTPSG